MAVDIKETTIQGDRINTTENSTYINQTTNTAGGGATAENITQAPEHKSAIEMCNETFPTPKGTAYINTAILVQCQKKK